MEKIKSVQERRHENLLLVMRHFKYENPDRSSDRAFAEALGVDPAEVYRAKSQKREITDELMRKIEEYCGLPENYLDFFSFNKKGVDNFV